MNNGDVAWDWPDQHLHSLTAPSEQQCFPNQHHGERPPPSLRALHMEDYEKLPFGRAPRSSCARFAQRLREGPSRSRSLQFQLFVGLLLSHGFLTKSSPETCTFLAARRMMSPREATLFRRGSQLANRAPRRILHHRLASTQCQTDLPTGPELLS